MKLAALIILVLASVLAGCATSSSHRPFPVLGEDANKCKPHFLRTTPPRYPPDQLRTRTEGWVVLGFDLDGSGVPVNVREIDSEPTGAFVEAAVSAMTTARYREGIVESGCIYPFKFSLG